MKKTKYEEGAMKLPLKLIILLTIVMLFSNSVFAKEQIPPRLITVTGEAEIKVVPNEIILTFGVEKWNKELNIAKTENDQIVQKVFQVAKEYGIESKNIQTDYLDIQPRYEHQYERRKFIGYFVTKSIVITLKETSKFENFLSDVLETGVNYVRGVKFQTTELRKHKDQARALAIKAAKEKAQNLAAELGQTVERPYSIQENFANLQVLGGNTMTQNVVQRVGGSSESGVSTALGQIKVNAKVVVSFELE